MKNTGNILRRAAFAGLLLAASATVVGAGPSAAAGYSYDGVKITSTRSFDDARPVHLQDLVTARISRVGITPIPIP